MFHQTNKNGNSIATASKVITRSDRHTDTHRNYQNSTHPHRHTEAHHCHYTQMPHVFRPTWCLLSATQQKLFEEKKEKNRSLDSYHIVLPQMCMWVFSSDSGHLSKITSLEARKFEYDRNK